MRLSKERIKVENDFCQSKKRLKFFQQPIEIDANGWIRMNLIAGIINRELGF